MANPHKGELPFEYNGKQLVMRLNVDEICAAEYETDLGIGEMIDRMRRGTNFRVCRALFRAGTGGVVDVNQAIVDIGLEASMALVMRALALAFPPKGEEAGENPQESPAAGTGLNS